MTPIVYIVDDDADVRTALARLLGSASFDAAAFASPQEFLTRFDRSRPSCLVLDLAMPGIDGLELQRILETEAKLLPVVFLTGHGDISASVKAMKRGAVDFLTKPVDAGQLIACVREAMHTCESGTDCPPGNGAHGCFDVLTEREREVVGLALDGRSNKEIARVLGISHRTVEFHRSRVLAKTGATSLIQLAAGRIMSPMRPKGDG